MHLLFVLRWLPIPFCLLSGILIAAIPPTPPAGDFLHDLAGLLSVLSCGLGLLWLWIDRDELTWHDRLAGTQVVVLPKPPR